jgi:hypothetical protein
MNIFLEDGKEAILQIIIGLHEGFFNKGFLG